MVYPAPWGNRQIRLLQAVILAIVACSVHHYTQAQQQGFRSLLVANSPERTGGPDYQWERTRCRAKGCTTAGFCKYRFGFGPPSVGAVSKTNSSMCVPFEWGGTVQLDTVRRLQAVSYLNVYNSALTWVKKKSPLVIDGGLGKPLKPVYICRTFVPVKRKQVQLLGVADGRDGQCYTSNGATSSFEYLALVAPPPSPPSPPKPPPSPPSPPAPPSGPARYIWEFWRCASRDCTRTDTCIFTIVLGGDAIVGDQMGRVIPDEEGFDACVPYKPLRGNEDQTSMRYLNFYDGTPLWTDAMPSQPVRSPSYVWMAAGGLVCRARNQSGEPAPQWKYGVVSSDNKTCGAMKNFGEAEQVYGSAFQWLLLAAPPPSPPTPPQPPPSPPSPPSPPAPPPAKSPPNIPKDYPPKRKSPPPPPPKITKDYPPNRKSPPLPPPKITKDYPPKRKSSPPPPPKAIKDYPPKRKTSPSPPKTKASSPRKQPTTRKPPPGIAKRPTSAAAKGRPTPPRGSR